MGDIIMGGITGEGITEVISGEVAGVIREVIAVVEDVAVEEEGQADRRLRCVISKPWYPL
jgi:hypothetical protein